ncbi:hypothetical protein F4777DRAFT_556074 [Nemania sp. FL0916]|nr:hypothetical protein F4777DRAFT_556074 [Nemania sp. FL0916]
MTISTLCILLGFSVSSTPKGGPSMSRCMVEPGLWTEDSRISHIMRSPRQQPAYSFRGRIFPRRYRGAYGGRRQPL